MFLQLFRFKYMSFPSIYILSITYCFFKTSNFFELYPFWNHFPWIIKHKNRCVWFEMWETEMETTDSEFLGLVVCYPAFWVGDFDWCWKEIVRRRRHQKTCKSMQLSQSCFHIRNLLFLIGIYSKFWTGIPSQGYTGRPVTGYTPLMAFGYTPSRGILLWRLPGIPK